MSRTATGIWWSPTAEGTPALVVTAAFFTLGGLAGCLLAFHMTDIGTEAMAAYLDRFLTVAQEGKLEFPIFPELLWRTFRWLLVVFFLGFSSLGILGIPVVCSARGFLLAFSIASFARAYGRDGLAIAFFLLGISGFLSIPAFLLMATQSFSSAWTLAGRSGRKERPFCREYFLYCGVCVLLACVSLLLERHLVPALVSGAAGALLS